MDGKRLEILVNGTWGTVCEVGFTDVEARVRLVHTHLLRMRKYVKPIDVKINVTKISLQTGILFFLC